MIIGKEEEDQYRQQGKGDFFADGISLEIQGINQSCNSQYKQGIKQITADDVA